MYQVLWSSTIPWTGLVTQPMETHMLSQMVHIVEKPQQRVDTLRSDSLMEMLLKHHLIYFANSIEYKVKILTSIQIMYMTP